MITIKKNHKFFLGGGWILDNTNKILIIAIVILVGVLGIAGGYLLQGYLIKGNNSTVNQSNNTVNSTDSTTTESSSGSSNQQSGEITRDQAISIALSAAGPIDQPYYVQTSYSVGNPHKWHVDFYNSKTNKHIVGVSINAVTGEVRAVYHL